MRISSSASVESVDHNAILVAFSSAEWTILRLRQVNLSSLCTYAIFYSAGCYFFHADLQLVYRRSKLSIYISPNKDILNMDA